MSKSYYIDEYSTSLDDLQARLEATDLIPSLQPLLDGLAGKMEVLKKAGINSVADLRVRLKNKKSLVSCAGYTGIDAEYLILLRRMVEGFFPKPQPLKIYEWLNKDVLVKLEKIGVRNTRHLYEAASSDINKLVKDTGVGEKELSEFMTLSDLSRIQWVSPTFARTLAAAGYTSAVKVATANPEMLCDAVMQANEGARFYKGKVGLRDIKRLITAATYTP